MSDSMVKFGEDEIPPQAATVGTVAEPDAADELVPAKPKRSRGKAAAAVDPEEVATVVAEPPMRPSVAAKRAVEATGDPRVDVYRWLRSEGLPNPMRKIRVSIAGGSLSQFLGLEPAEIEAVDPSAAVNAYAELRGIPHKFRHGVHFTTVILEE